MIAYVLDRKRSREAAVGAGPAVSSCVKTVTCIKPLKFEKVMEVLR